MLPHIGISAVKLVRCHTQIGSFCRQSRETLGAQEGFWRCFGSLPPWKSWDTPVSLLSCCRVCPRRQDKRCFTGVEQDGGPTACASINTPDSDSEHKDKGHLEMQKRLLFTHFHHNGKYYYLTTTKQTKYWTLIMDREKWLPILHGTLVQCERESGKHFRKLKFTSVCLLSWNWLFQNVSNLCHGAMCDIQHITKLIT